MRTAQSRPEAAPRIALPWIVRLRYALAAGQMATAILVDQALGIDLPLGWIAVVPAVVALSNLWLSRWASRPEASGGFAPSRIVACVFVLDTICLTALLMLTGGPNNPFTLLYLVHITLSAAILTKRQTWALGGLATVCFGLLFLVYRPIPALEMHHVGQGANLHLIGMWVGFAVAAFLVAMFSGKISELLREREDSLLHMQESLSKRDRLASLATLAAGAAHELNTPLATIAVIAKELERYATETVRDAAIAEDSRLIRAELERCREILSRMSAEGAEPAGEAVETVAADDLLAGVARSFEQTARVQVERVDGGFPAVTVPRHAVERAIAALVKNGLQASPPEGGVSVCAKRSGDSLSFVVSDRGAGMAPEILRHVGEPFFTTKEPGQGMGLGVFLVRTLAERLGGRLTFESSLGSGTVATLELPSTRSREPVGAHE